jgi:ketosteroid isomerase-like protein
MESVQFREMLRRDVAGERGDRAAVLRRNRARGLDELREAAANYSSKLLETSDLEADRVLAVFALSLERRGSGIQIDAKVFAVVRFDDGLIARIDEYADRAEALEAAGLWK